MTQKNLAPVEREYWEDVLRLLSSTGAEVMSVDLERREVVVRIPQLRSSR